MAANQVRLSEASGAPVLINGEQTTITVDQCEFEALSGTGYPGSSGNFFTNQCRVIITNLRVIIIPSHPTPQFTTFSLPMYLINDEKLKTPMMGKPSLNGIIHPVTGMGLVGEGRFSIIFMKNYIATDFLQVLESQLESARYCQLHGGPLSVGYNAVCAPLLQAAPAPIVYQYPSAVLESAPNRAYVNSADTSIMYLPIPSSAASPPPSQPISHVHVAPLTQNEIILPSTNAISPQAAVPDTTHDDAINDDDEKFNLLSSMPAPIRSKQPRQSSSKAPEDDHFELLLQ